MVVIGKDIRAQFENAAARARKNLVKVEINKQEFGKYSVISRNSSNVYFLTFEKADGKKTVDCTCLGASNGRICYHMAAVLPIHVQRASKSSRI